MAKAPTIAIFAHSSAKTAYLTDLAARAGFDVVESAPLLLAERSAPTDAAKKIILGEGQSNASVRYVSFPVKAAGLIRMIQNAHRAANTKDGILTIGNHTLDMRESLWNTQGKDSVRLTEKEVAILSYLAELKGSKAGREDLLSCVWDYAQGVETHTLETHIYRLRQKIERDPADPKIILTMEDGYALGVQV